MLEQIQIDGFMRIAEADSDIRSHRIHAFTGANEAGKSSLLESIAFCIRGLSPRVKYKHQFDELLFRGKKKGSVKLVMDGFDITRNIKTGKLETTAPLDYHNLLVDIQLGREQFGLCAQEDLRQMMQKTFNIESTTKYIGERLEKKGITKSMVDRVIPLLKAGGFETASETARQRYLEKRGAWEQVTGETYGSNKAIDWEPKDADLYKPVNMEELKLAQEAVGVANKKRSEADQRLGAMNKAAELQSAAEQLESIEDIETHLQSLLDVEKAYQDVIPSLRKMMEAELTGVDAEIEKLNNDIQRAKMQAATLECPDCAAPLKLHTEGDKARLVKAEGIERREGVSLSALLEQLEDARALRHELVAARTAKIQKTERNLLDASRDREAEQRKLEVAKSASAAQVTAADIEAAEKAADEATIAYENAKSYLAKLQSDDANFTGLAVRKTKADEIANEAAQWSLASDLLSNKPDSIPSELVQRTVGPINNMLMQICSTWNQPPIVIDGSMGLMRGDGYRYNMLSESARWRADVAVQLALAALGTLKLVAIDRFDVLEPSARGPMFDMLEWFSEKHPDVTVLLTGTLKAKPELGDVIKCWWIENGEVTE